VRVDDFAQDLGTSLLRPSAQGEDPTNLSRPTAMPPRRAVA
jgi:hypothetical protein